MAKRQQKRVTRPVSKLTKAQKEANERSIRCLNKIQKALIEENCAINIIPHPVNPGEQPRYTVDIMALPLRK